MSTTPRTLRGWAPTALAVVIIDQVTKTWAVHRLPRGDVDIVWTLRFHLSYNSGMSFGRGQGLGPVIGVVAMLIVVGVLLSLRRQPGRLTDVAVGLIVGGATGNIIDRLFRQEGWLHGSVVDFIDFQWFPIFNLADTGITVGGFLMVGGAWWASRQHAPVDPVGPDIADVDSSTPDEPEPST
jgi:signal peptidase II